MVRVPFLQGVLLTVMFLAAPVPTLAQEAVEPVPGAEVTQGPIVPGAPGVEGPTAQIVTEDCVRTPVSRGALWRAAIFEAIVGTALGFLARPGTVLLVGSLGLAMVAVALGLSGGLTSGFSQGNLIEFFFGTRIPAVTLVLAALVPIALLAAPAFDLVAFPLGAMLLPSAPKSAFWLALIASAPIALAVTTLFAIGATATVAALWQAPAPGLVPSLLNNEQAWVTMGSIALGATLLGVLACVAYDLTLRPLFYILMRVFVGGA